MCVRLQKSRTCVGCRTFVYTPSLGVGIPSRRVGIPSGRAVSIHTPSPSVRLSLFVGSRVRCMSLIHAHTRFSRSQTISTVCVCHFSSVWVCRHTAWIKTHSCRRSDTDCRFRLFCSICGQRVKPRPSVTVA